MINGQKYKASNNIPGAPIPTSPLSTKINDTPRLFNLGQGSSSLLYFSSLASLSLRSLWFLAIAFSNAAVEPLISCARANGGNGVSGVGASQGTEEERGGRERKNRTQDEACEKLVERVCMKKLPRLA